MTLAPNTCHGIHPMLHFPSTLQTNHFCNPSQPCSVYGLSDDNESEVEVEDCPACASPTAHHASLSGVTDLTRTHSINEISHYEGVRHVELVSFLSQIVTPAVTALPNSAQSLSSSRTSIIAGSTTAGITLLILARATLVFCCATGRSRAPSVSHPAPLFYQGKKDLPLPNPPFVSLDQPDPFATHNLAPQ